MGFLTTVRNLFLARTCQPPRQTKSGMDGLRGAHGGRCVGAELATARATGNVCSLWRFAAFGTISDATPWPGRPTRAGPPSNSTAKESPWPCSHALTRKPV